VAEVSAGTVLAGKYRVDRFLGQGGMGVVVEARHISLDDRVALKFLLPEYASHPEAAQRFMREARAAVKVKGPHVARVSDVGTLENGAPYMVMEFLEGMDASKLIEQEQLSIPEAIDFVVQASDAISEAHSHGIVHRDLKPANLFVTRHKDGSPFIKVLDFGISKTVGDGGVDGLTRTNATMGSALYMSPEQIRQAKSVDHRTDIYALGVTLYELLTRRQPFIADSFAALCVEIATGVPIPLRQVRPDIPPELAAAIEKAFARDPAHRYQSIAELVVALGPWALPRSQPIIERIARSQGLSPGLAPVASPDVQPQIAPARTDFTSGATLPPRTRSIVLPLVVGLMGLLGVGVVGAFVLFQVLGSAETPTPEAPAATVQPPAPATELPAEPTASPSPTAPRSPVGPAAATPTDKPDASSERPKTDGGLKPSSPKVSSMTDKAKLGTDVKPKLSPTATVKRTAP
jgi:serine/threonine-protein kinase